MIKVKVYDHPFAVVKPKEFKCNNLAEWLVEYYGKEPKVTLQIFKGEPSSSTDITQDYKAILDANNDKSSWNSYTILESPGGPELTIPVILSQIAMAIAVSVVMSLLFPPPDMPGNVNRTQSSPNNSLGSRENQVRLNQRVEDIYGKVKSIPSLMMPTYNKYIEHKQYEYGYYCVGRGYYEITNVKDDNTFISDLSGAKASVYEPFASPNAGSPQLQINGSIDDNLFTVARSSKIDGITLKAINQIQLPDTGAYRFTKSSDTTDNNGDVISGWSAPFDLKPPISSVCAAGDYINVVMPDVVIEEYNYFFADGSPATAADEYSYTELVSSETYNYSGNYEINYVSGEDMILTTTTFTKTLSLSGLLGPTVLSTVKIQDLVDSIKVIRNEYTDWITLKEISRTQVWTNILARSGIYLGRDGRKDAWGVAFDIEIEKLEPTTFSPTGIVEVIHSSLTGATTDERAITLEHTTAWVGPGRVRARRTSPYDYGIAGTIVDEIKWQDLYSVTPVNQLHFGNKTTIHTVTKATARATSISGRKLNCIASRKLPTYSKYSGAFSGAFNSSGRLVTGVINETSRLCDILYAIAADPKIGGNASQVDISQIFSVQEELDSWSSEAGQFNYTFDTDSTSFEETVTMVANAGFCIAYRQNGKIRLSLDKKQDYSTALFTHRNKKPESESITRSFATDSEYDGVEFVYQDPDTELAETIKLPLDDSATKYKKFEIPGIRSFEQAWYRANREYKKQRLQRLSIETECTTDARLLLPNTRVDIVDNTRFKSYDGEVIKQDGLVLTLSRDVTFTSGSNHSILLMKRNGELQSIQCTQGTSANQVILQSLPAEPIVTIYGIDGIRTIFSFASDSMRNSQAWLVQEVGISDGQYIKIKAINYSPDYYYWDTQEVPDKHPIIGIDA